MRVAERTNKHWGYWVQLRSEFVGIRSQKGLAFIIGCSRQQLVNWLASEVPPRRMSKNFDQELATALCTTRQMLFSDWKTVAPQDAPRLLEPDDSRVREWRKREWQSLSDEEKFRDLKSRCPPEVIRRMLDVGVIYLDGLVDGSTQMQNALAPFVWKEVDKKRAEMREQEKHAKERP